MPFVWAPTSQPVTGKTWVTDRETLFHYLDLLNDKYDTDFCWHWSGQDKVPAIEVYSPKMGLSVEAPMGFIQETVERMLPIWGLVTT
jgi:hypothetical protein